MSRSYKKTAGWCDRNPFMKNYANRKVRQISVWKDIDADNSWYKRYTCPWDICDYKSLYWSDNEIKAWNESWLKKYGWGDDMTTPMYRYRMK